MSEIIRCSILVFVDVCVLCVCECGVRRFKCLAAGEMYEGYWIDGCCEGTGLISNPRTGHLHRGEFKKGMRHGVGICFNPDGSFLDAKWIQDVVENSSETLKNVQLQQKDSKRIKKKLKTHAKLGNVASEKDDLEGKLDSHQIDFASHLHDLPPPSFAPLTVQNASQKKKKTKRSSVGISEPPNPFAQYDNYCDRMAEWNVDIERKETGAERGKGV